MKFISGKWLQSRALAAALSVGLLLPSAAAETVEVDFSDVTLDAGSQWYGVDVTYNNGSGDHHTSVICGAAFNTYHEWYYDGWNGEPTHYWDGWAYSNRTDTASTGTDGQFTAMALGGQSNNVYGAAYLGYYNDPAVDFDAPCAVASASFTNNAYAYHSMLNGDSYAKQFGGPNGSDEDWFLLTVTGKDASGAVTGSVDFYLADYRGEDDYIIDDWTEVDLSGLGSNISSLEFALNSSDVGDWGMNTPAYFAMDNLTVVPEPSTIAMLIAGLLAVFVWRRRRQGD